MRSITFSAIVALAQCLIVSIAWSRGYRRGRRAGYREGHEVGRYRECRWWAEVDGLDADKMPAPPKRPRWA